MRIIPKRTAEAESLDLTPLIDVVFLLIIFFLVTTSFQMLQRELQVDLAKAKVAETVSIDIQPVTITVSREGRVTMGGEDVSLEELPERLKAAAKEAKTRVYVRGDAKTFHENIVAVLSACLAADVRDVSLVTE